MATLETLDQIKAHPWVGVFHFDSQAIKEVTAFAQNPGNSLADRAQAVREIISGAMGLSEDELMRKPDHELLAAFMAAGAFL